MCLTKIITNCKMCRYQCFNFATALKTCIHLFHDFVAIQNKHWQITSNKKWFLIMSGTNYFTDLLDMLCHNAHAATHVWFDTQIFEISVQVTPTNHFVRNWHIHVLSCMFYLCLFSQRKNVFEQNYRALYTATPTTKSMTTNIVIHQVQLAFWNGY